MSSRILSQSLLAVLLALCAAGMLAAMPRRAAPVVVQADAVGPFIAEGETAQIRNFFGFREVERAGDTPFRWTSGAGSFVVRGGARMGAPLLLDVRLCGCRAESAPAPRLRLRAGGATLADTRATARWDAWRRYRVLIPPTGMPGGDLSIELLSDYVPNAATGAPLGVAFQRARIAPLGVQRAYVPAAALGLALLVGAVSYATWRRSGSARRALLVGALALVGAAAQGYVGAAALPAWALAGGGILAVGAAAVREPSAKRQEPTQGWAHTVSVSACQLVILSLPILLTQLLGVWMLDDAYISFRYARNALLGHGFVFNPGERVEGYTNFLWTALFVPLIGAGADPALAAQVLTLLLALVIVALTWAGARRVAGAGAALAALLLLVTSAPFLLYTARGSGMETALFTALVLAGLLLGGVRGQGTGDRGQGTGGEKRFHPFTPSPLHPFIWSGILLGLAAMTRPEGVLVAGVVGLWLFVGAWRSHRRHTADRLKRVEPVRQLVLFAAGFLLIFAPYYLWRYSYYGYPLPNTFYAKVGGTGAQLWRGLEYAQEFALAQWPLVALALGFTIYALRGAVKPSVQPPHQLVSLSACQLVTIVYTLYIIAVGGDHFPLFRFFVPLLPLLAILAAAGLQAMIADALLNARFGTLRRALLAAVVLGGLAWHAPQLYESRTLNADSQVWGENSVVEKNREIGLWLRANTPPDTLIATGIAGALPYYSERPVLDALGLNDLHIAHIEVPTMGAGVAGSEKTDMPYILSRRPAYIPAHSAEGFLSNPLFASAYQRMTVRGPEGRAVRLYRRADLPAPVGSRAAAP